MSKKTPRGDTSKRGLLGRNSPKADMLHLSQNFGIHSTINADSNISNIIEKVHTTIRDKKHACMTIPDTAIYSTLVSHKKAALTKLKRDNVTVNLNDNPNPVEVKVELKRDNNQYDKFLQSPNFDIGQISYAPQQMKYDTDEPGVPIPDAMSQVMLRRRFKDPAACISPKVSPSARKRPTPKISSDSLNKSAGRKSTPRRGSIIAPKITQKFNQTNNEDLKEKLDSFATPEKVTGGLFKAFIWGDKYSQRNIPQVKSRIDQIHEQDDMTEDQLSSIKKLYAKRAAVDAYKAEQKRKIEEKLAAGMKGQDDQKLQKELELGKLTTDSKGAPLKKRNIAADTHVIINDGMQITDKPVSTKKEMTFQSKFAAALLKLIRRKATKGREERCAKDPAIILLKNMRTKRANTKNILADPSNNFALFKKKEEKPVSGVNTPAEKVVTAMPENQEFVEIKIQPNEGVVFQNNRGRIHGPGYADTTTQQSMGPHPRFKSEVKTQPGIQRYYRESRVNSSCPGPDEFSEETLEDVNYIDSPSLRQSSRKKDREIRHHRNATTPSVQSILNSNRPEFKIRMDGVDTLRNRQKTPNVLASHTLNQEAIKLINKRSAAFSTLSKPQRSKITVGECQQDFISLLKTPKHNHFNTIQQFDIANFDKMNSSAIRDNFTASTLSTANRNFVSSQGQTNIYSSGMSGNVPMTPKQRTRNKVQNNNSTIQHFEVASKTYQDHGRSFVNSNAAVNAQMTRGKGTFNFENLMVPEARETFFNRRTIHSSQVGKRSRAAFVGQLKSAAQIGAISNGHTKSRSLMASKVKPFS